MFKFKKFKIENLFLQQNKIKLKKIFKILNKIKKINYNQHKM